MEARADGQPLEEKTGKHLDAQWQKKKSGLCQAQHVSSKHLKDEHGLPVQPTPTPSPSRRWATDAASAGSENELIEACSWQGALPAALRLWPRP